MIFESTQDFYSLLEVEQSASLQEIKSAYLKIKSAYRKDNLALYGMMDSLQCDLILEKIEEAYVTLSNPELRKDYDVQKRFEEPMRTDGLFSETKSAEIPSIDRTPPMEMGDDSDLLNPPSTDFAFPAGGEGLRTENALVQNSLTSASGINETSMAAALTNGALGMAVDAAMGAAIPSDSTGLTQTGTRASATGTASSYAAEANKAGGTEGVSENEKKSAAPFHNTVHTPAPEWNGLALRKTRESKRLSIDEVSSLTRISKTYLQAIEDETFDKLPATVFVRGFIIQYSKILKIPPEVVATNYMSRFRKSNA